MNHEGPIFFTDEAVLQALKLRENNPSYLDLPLRVYIEGKGCDGFTYGVAFDSAIQGDVRFEIENLSVVIDSEAHRFIKGSTVEWVDDNRGRGFLVNNPNQRKFKGKFFKKEAWKEEFPNDK